MKWALFFSGFLVWAQTEIPKQAMTTVQKQGSGIEVVIDGWQSELLEEIIAGSQRAMKSGSGDGGEGEPPDPEETMRDGVDQGWRDSDHGDVSLTGPQAEAHARNEARVMGLYGEMPYQTFSASQAYAISPEPDPTKEYGVVSSMGCPGSGRVVMWQQLGAMEVRSEGVHEDSEWKLTALNGKPRPPGWGRMNNCQREDWQHRVNKWLVGVRKVRPEETYPQPMTLRPSDYFEYFELEHDWCDPCYENPCEERFTEFFPKLAMAQGFEGELVPIFWEIDYHPGETADYESDWDKRSIRNGHQVPIFEPGSAGLAMNGSLPDVVELDIVCRTEDGDGEQ